MMMYDELVKDLRYLAKVYSICENENTKEYKLAVEAADAIEELCKPKWIPVTERLPSIGEEVIVFADRTTIRIWSLERYYPTIADVFWEREDGYHEDASEVTHWMPLPEPPESEE